jgi:hypothetical protein
VAWRLFALALATLAVVPAALAQETDRVRVSPNGFSSATAVTVTVLPEFRRTGFDGDSGGWEGPMCDHPQPSLSSPVALTWGVGFENRSRTAEEAASAALTFRWKVVERTTISVRHLVAGRDVGAIPGTLLVTDSESPQGWHEAGLGFPVGRGFFAGAEAWSRGNGFPCQVRSAQGPVHSTSWHRQKSRQALESIRLEGSLPPARTTARGSASRVTGTVRDGFGHPVAGALVALERRVGRAWRRAGSGRATAVGGYAIRVRKRGRYRAVATLAGSSARSGVVRAGR